jgi:hypothetical protein
MDATAKLVCSLAFLFIITGQPQAQTTTGKAHSFTLKKQGVVKPGEIQEDWAPVLETQEMPLPGMERNKLEKVKDRIKERFPRSPHPTRKRKKSNKTTAHPPIIGKSLVGNEFNGGVPNDNHLSVSNNDYLVSVINSTILGYDLPADTALFTVSLDAFADTLGLSGNKYDPKVLYDPTQDRHIMVFLNGTSSNNSKIVVAFSSDANPKLTWHLYTVDGSPLSDTTWSDYPAIAITQKEFFLTINLLVDGQSWQSGFTRTLLWQMDKSAGFSGKDSVPTQLWREIKYQGDYVRYLHPIQAGAMPQNHDLYFLSNRNFAVQNDTFFIAHLTDTIGGENAKITVNRGRTDKTYGAPPNGRQANNHELATNDARMLGAFQKDTQVQFVHNTIDTTTGLAAVYHGVIEDITADVPKAKGHIISSDTLDYGYPNIAYVGRACCEYESIITFNHTSPNEPAGCSGVYYSNLGNHSEPVFLKRGDGYINHLLSTTERWGDYSGIQRKYNAPGKVWMAGMWGDSTNDQATWINQLTTPDTASVLVAQISDSSDQSLYNQCDGSLKAQVKGGHPPYSYQWGDSNRQTSQVATGLCEGTYTVWVTDSLGCTYSASARVEEPPPQQSLFPNPTKDRVTVKFQADKATPVTFAIYDMSGRLVKRLMHEQVGQGRNLFSFSTEPLAEGMYVLKIENAEGVLMQKKFMKLETGVR